MILLAAALLAGDAWTWDVTLRYEDSEGPLLVERERWSVRVGPKVALTAERRYLGTLIDGTLIASKAEPEILKGVIDKDGNLSLKGEWSDPDAAKAFRRLLTPDRALPDRLPGWSVVRKGLLIDGEAKLPGSGLPARLTVATSLLSARLGGKDIKVPAPEAQG